MKGKRILISLLVLGLLLALAVGLSQAQGPEPPEGKVGVEGEAGAEAVVGAIPEAVVANVIPIQGRLTNAGGNPLSGSYSVRARIYDASTGGTTLCDDTDTVTADNNGLFNMGMDFCTPSDIDGKPLYLGIQVGSDPEMTPRRPIYPVPYAWTVRPDAIIKGADSYLFTPGNAFVKNSSDDSTRWTMWGGVAMIYRGATAGIKYIRIPITIPSVLYGQPTRVTQVTVYYKCQNGAHNYISGTWLSKMTGADSFQYLVEDSTDRTSNTATSYTLLTNSAYNTLSADQGILTLLLHLNFVNDTEYVQIGGVRLTLDHNY